jgi:hypothetical protein
MVKLPIKPQDIAQFFLTVETSLLKHSQPLQSSIQREQRNEHFITVPEEIRISFLFDERGNPTRHTPKALHVHHKGKNYLRLVPVHQLSSRHFRLHVCDIAGTLTPVFTDVCMSPQFNIHRHALATIAAVTPPGWE